MSSTLSSSSSSSTTTSATATAVAAATAASTATMEAASSIQSDYHVSPEYFERVLNQWREVTSPDSEEGTLDGVSGPENRSLLDTTTTEYRDNQENGRALRRLEILLDKAGVPHKFFRHQEVDSNRTSQNISPAKNYKNLHQQLKTDSLPPELKRCRPLNRPDFMARLRTFSSRTWFGKPDTVNAIRCARYGWINVGVDELYCTACHAHTFFKSTAYGSATTLQEEADEFRRDLTRGHRKHCPWNANPSPSSFGQLRPVPGPNLIKSMAVRGQRIRNCLERLATERKKHKLTDLISLHPDISETLNSIRSIFSDAESKETRGSISGNCSTVQLTSISHQSCPRQQQQAGFASTISTCVERLQGIGITSIDELLLLLTCVRWLTSSDSQGWEKFLDGLKQYNMSAAKESTVVSDIDIGERELSIDDLGSNGDKDDGFLLREAMPEILALFGWDLVKVGLASSKGSQALICHWCQQTYFLADLLHPSESHSSKANSKGLGSSRYLQAAAAALSACNSASSVSRSGRTGSTGSSGGNSVESGNKVTFHPVLEHRACCPWVLRKGVNPVALSGTSLGHPGTLHPCSSYESFHDIEECTLSAIKSISRAAMGAMDLERLVQYSDRVANDEVTEKHNAGADTDASLFSDLDDDDETPSQKVFRDFYTGQEAGLRNWENSLTPRKRARDNSRYSTASKRKESHPQEGVKFSKSSAWISGWLAYALALRQAFYQVGLSAIHSS